MFQIKYFSNISIDFDSNDNKLIFSGPQGTTDLCLKNVIVNIDSKNYILELKANSSLTCTKALLKTNLSLIKKKIKGVFQGYKRQIYLKGVGYKFQVNNDYLILTLGFSHDILVKIPKQIKIQIIKKSTTLILSSFDDQYLTQFISCIRKFKKPEVYKGKGILYKEEIIKLKEGKKKKK